MNTNIFIPQPRHTSLQGRQWTESIQSGLNTMANLSFDDNYFFVEKDNTGWRISVRTTGSFEPPKSHKVTLHSGNLVDITGGAFNIHGLFNGQLESLTSSREEPEEPEEDPVITGLELQGGECWVVIKYTHQSQDLEYDISLTYPVSDTYQIIIPLVEYMQVSNNNYKRVKICYDGDVHLGSFIR